MTRDYLWLYMFGHWGFLMSYDLHNFLGQPLKSIMALEKDCCALDASHSESTTSRDDVNEDNLFFFSIASSVPINSGSAIQE